MNVGLILFFRWLHIATACVAVGGAFVMRLVVPVGLRVLKDEDRRAAFLKMRRVFKMVIHTSILLLLVSGIYNTWLNWSAYNQIPEMAHPLWGTHVLLALIIFSIALYVLAGAQPPAGHAKWMAINLVLMAAVIAAAGSLKYVREHRPIPAPPPSAFASSHSIVSAHLE